MSHHQGNERSHIGHAQLAVGVHIARQHCFSHRIVSVDAVDGQRVLLLAALLQVELYLTQRDGISGHVRRAAQLVQVDARAVNGVHVAPVRHFHRLVVERAVGGVANVEHHRRNLQRAREVNTDAVGQAEQRELLQQAQIRGAPAAQRETHHTRRRVKADVLHP